MTSKDSELLGRLLADPFSQAVGLQKGSHTHIRASFQRLWIGIRLGNPDSAKRPMHRLDPRTTLLGRH